MPTILPKHPLSILRLLALSLYHFLPLMYRCCIPLILLGLTHVLYLYLMNLTANQLILSLVVILIYSSITLIIGTIILQATNITAQCEPLSLPEVMKQSRYRIADVLGGFYLLIIGGSLATLAGWYAGLGFSHFFQSTDTKQFVHLWITGSFTLAYFCVFSFAIPILALEKISIIKAFVKAKQLLKIKSCWIRQTMSYAFIVLYFLMMTQQTHHTQWLKTHRLFESFQIVWTLLFFPLTIQFIRLLVHDCELRKAAHEKITQQKQKKIT